MMKTKEMTYFEKKKYSNKQIKDNLYMNNVQLTPK